MSTSVTVPSCGFFSPEYRLHWGSFLLWLQCPIDSLDAGECSMFPLMLAKTTYCIRSRVGGRLLQYEPTLGWIFCLQPVQKTPKQSVILLLPLMRISGILLTAILLTLHLKMNYSWQHYQNIVGFRIGFTILALLMHISVLSQRLRTLLREALCY